MDSTIVEDLLRIAKHDRNHGWEADALLKERAANHIKELEQKIEQLRKDLKKQKLAAKQSAS